jgi:hypothetical protein
MVAASRRRPLWIAAAMVVLFAGGACVAWQMFGPKILRSPEYRIGRDQIEITPLPGWIHSDVLGEVYRDAALDGPLSTTDDNLTERVTRAFARHPWIAKVAQVRTKYPASVTVDLVYRRPVCMVEVPGDVLPVDIEAVLLPSQDFSPVERAHYPHLTGIEQKPSVRPGEHWADAKVLGGAEIAAAVLPEWESLGLKGIDPAAADPARQSAEPLFVLITRGGSRIIWGYAPGANVPGELSAGEKVARLKRYLTVNDTLDGPGGRPQELDVRKLRATAGG